MGLLKRNVELLLGIMGNLWMIPVESLVLMILACTIIATSAQDDDGCSDVQFACKENGDCVDMGLRCDREYDCTDRSDELDCVCNTTTEWQCGAGDCIDKEFRCDGTPDCSDKSDETCPCNLYTEFSCHDSSRCIPH